LLEVVLRNYGLKEQEEAQAMVCDLRDLNPSDIPFDIHHLAHSSSPTSASTAPPSKPLNPYALGPARHSFDINISKHRNAAELDRRRREVDMGLYQVRKDEEPQKALPRGHAEGRKDKGKGDGKSLLTDTIFETPNNSK